MVFPRSHGIDAVEPGLGPQVWGLRIQIATLFLSLHKHVIVNFQFRSNFVLFIS